MSVVSSRIAHDHAPRRLSTLGLHALLVLAGVCACVRPPAGPSAPEGPTRLPILDPGYGASADHPAAIRVGDRVGDHLGALALPLADGGVFELGDALSAGPVVLVWIGGAEHGALTDWIGTLDRSLAQLDERGATLVFVRPLEAEAALRWAMELRVQTAVAGDPNGELAASLDALGAPGEPAGALEFAVLIVAETQVAYRKLGGRRPALTELLAVLDGEADGLRCCPEECTGEVCE